jgi:hypothetical protein
MTEARFDELIHPSTRLSIVALLTGADWAEFGFLRDQLELSDSALSKQLRGRPRRAISLRGAGGGSDRARDGAPRHLRGLRALRRPLTDLVAEGLGRREPVEC